MSLREAARDSRREAWAVQCPAARVWVESVGAASPTVCDVVAVVVVAVVENRVPVHAARMGIVAVVVEVVAAGPVGHSRGTGRGEARWDSPALMVCPRKKETPQQGTKGLSWWGRESPCWRGSS